MKLDVVVLDAALKESVLAALKDEAIGARRLLGTAPTGALEELLSQSLEDKG